MPSHFRGHFHGHCVRAYGLGQLPLEPLLADKATCHTAIDSIGLLSLGDVRPGLSKRHGGLGPKD